jgi:hypothetical protein
MTVDPTTLKVSLSSPEWLSLVQDIQGDYYESHHSVITHNDRQGPAIPVMLDLLMVNPDGTLIYRDKRQVVARLPNVTVLLQTDYFYAEQYRQAAPDVLVNVDRDLGWQVPREVDALPGSPAPTLTGAALVRVLPQPDGSLVVGCANYGATGRIRALNTRSLHDGRVDDSTVPIIVNRQTFGNGTSLGDQPASRDAFGFPAQFDVAAYLRQPRLPPLLAASPSVTDLVLLEYNFNEWIQRDTYTASRRTSTRLLHIDELAEDRMLMTLDRRGWNR